VKTSNLFQVGSPFSAISVTCDLLSMHHHVVTQTDT
jgi:hypothetical protein